MNVFNGKTMKQRKQIEAAMKKLLKGRYISFAKDTSARAKRKNKQKAAAK
jgi:hypothetical protein